jgi:lipopolysaccharide/colanic/teichoic acid biosynthesis glycosyltransferase
MPEPTTMALFGTGFSALVVQYVRRRYLRGKEIFDRTVGLCLLVAASPLILALALLVKLTSRGPAFYRQDRTGKDGRIFQIIKLRSMRLDAETQTGPVWAATKDPRVTLIGQIMRDMHLDELPQLWNVLRGDMSLVGPRPERPYFVERLRTTLPDYESRYRIKPGITGLAQVRSGPDHDLYDVRRKLRLDLMYLNRMCWWVDFAILARTAGKVLGAWKGVAGIKKHTPIA